jgi:hypothetical protein
MTASIGVSSSELADDGIRIGPALTRMAPNSSTTFHLYVRAKTDQLEQDLTSSAAWTVIGSTSPANISGTSTVTAARTPVDQPFTLEARLPVCNRDITRDMSIGNVSKLQLSYEQPEDQAVPVLLNDRVRVDAVFDDTTAPNQNITDQMKVEVADGYNESNGTTSTATASTVTTSAVGACGGTTCLESNSYLLVSGDADYLNREIAFKLTYDEDGLDLTTTSRVYTFKDTDIVSFRIDPTSTDLTYPYLGQLNAYAMFEDGIERPVTRYASWSLINYGDSDSLSVVGSGINGGLLTPNNVSDVAHVFATVESDTAGELEQNAAVTIHEQNKD